MPAKRHAAGAGVEKRLRILLNDRPLRTTLTGVGHYIQQLLWAIDGANEPVQLNPFLFGCVLRRNWRHSAHSPTDAVPKPASRGIGQSRKPYWLRRILDAGYGLAFRRTARPRRFDLYHEPNHIPIPCGLPTVTTIHDLSVLAHPEWHPSDRVRWYEREFSRGIRQSSRFIAASEFTRREIAQRCGVAPDRIDVTYQAPRPEFHPRPPGQCRAVRSALGLPERYFLFVGTLEPRKNLPGLLDAYAALPVTVRDRHPLVVVGAWGWSADSLRERLARRSLPAQVRVVGYVSDEQLACVYSGCTALVWPTFYEGFGLPPIEAMACGAAVITSNVASLPEVVGSAGVLLDPRETEPWSEAMLRMADDGPWRSAWSQRGLAQAQGFSWRRCALETVACYQRAVHAC